jgi:glycosyltransferase involved in cell wall biosynthesis
MKIAVTSIYDINNPKYWSGTIYYMIENLKRQDISIEYAENFKIPYRNYFRSKSLIYQKFLKSLYFKEKEPLIQKKYADFFNKKYKDSSYDIIFSPQTTELGYIESKKPMVFWVDATFNALIDELRYQVKLNTRGIELGNFYDRTALEKARLAIYSSDWAANSAINYYGASPERVKVVPFGANIKHEFNLEEIKNIVKKRDQNVCKLLFVGIDWERKGGEIAVEITRKLNEFSLKTELHIAGCNPALPQPIPDFVKIHSFIDKKTNEGLKKFISLFKESHFFIMPSLYEPYGIVFCEANSFALPAIGSDTGGIPTIIKDNINGLLMKQPVNIEIISENIIKLFQDKRTYNEIAISSYNEFKTRLNWESSCQIVKQLMSEII